MNMPGAAEAGAADAKACCASAYGSDAVALLLGESYHPGGLRLTRRLLDRLELPPGARVLDVAAGRGATAMLAAGEYDVAVDGVDLAADNVAAATRAAEAGGYGGRVTFRVGDAERLPYPDSTFDALVCECALCTFGDKSAAAAEFALVLRPGGRVGITDVIAEPDRLPAELTSIAAWVACIADARPLRGYVEVLAGAGLVVGHTESHDETIARMIDTIEARLSVVRMTMRDQAEALGLDFDRAGPVLAAARDAAARGALGYGLLVAAKPVP